MQWQIESEFNVQEDAERTLRINKTFNKAFTMDSVERVQEGFYFALGNREFPFFYSSLGVPESGGTG